MDVSAHRVLIIGSSTRVVVPIARALREKCGVEVDVLRLSPREHVIRSRAIQNCWAGSDFREEPEKFREELVQLIRTRNVDTILPAVDLALSAIVQDYDRLKSLVHVGCPPPEVVARVQDKELTLEFAQRCGIPIPRTINVASAADIEEVASGLRFPVVMKPSQTDPASFKARYLHTIEELKRAVATDSAGMILQEFRRGAGVGIEMLIHNGECLAVFQHRRLKEEPASGGVAAMAISEPPDPELAEAALKLLRAIEWEGVAMAEFRKDSASGRFALLEVNGRYWGTSSLPILAGMNFPVYHWRVLHGLDPQVPSSYSNGEPWRWTAGYLSRLHGLFLRSIPTNKTTSRSKLREFLDLPRDFSPGVRDALWSWSDPLPWFNELFRTVTDWFRADLKWVARKLVPKTLMRDRNIYGQLQSPAGKIFLKLRWLDRLHVGANRRKAPRTARSFVFVCYGNIMRSPMAAEMFRRELGKTGATHVVVQSAGLHARDGNEAHPWAQTAARELEMPLADHRARKLTPAMVQEADVIFAMDFANQAELFVLYPDARDKIVLLSAYADRGMRYREIADPYDGDLEGTRQCYRCIQTCVRNLTASLFEQSSAVALAQRTAVTG